MWNTKADDTNTNTKAGGGDDDANRQVSQLSKQTAHSNWSSFSIIRPKKVFTGRSLDDTLSQCWLPRGGQMFFVFIVCAAFTGFAGGPLRNVNVANIELFQFHYWTPAVMFSSEG